jgi:hypothetical protein
VVGPGAFGLKPGLGAMCSEVMLKQKLFLPIRSSQVGPGGEVT